MYDDLDDLLTYDQAARYLERIGLSEDARRLRLNLTEHPTDPPVEPTRELLDRLIYAHQLTVPFENLEIRELHKPVELGTGKLFDKIVNRNRGGYCFELNKSFNSLLKALGFKTTAHLGRIQMSAGALRPPTHRINLVYFQDGDSTKRYMSDVSFGGPQPASSILLEVGHHTDSLGAQFRMVYGEEDLPRGITKHAWFILRTSSAGEEQGLVSFEDYEQIEVNFVTPNYYTSNNPESRFVSGRTVNLRRTDGHAMISDDSFKLVSNGQTTEIDVSDAKVRAEVLKEYFNIVL